MANPITLLKERLNLNDEGLAARLGVHRSTVQRMERRKKIKGPTKLLLEEMLAKAPKGASQ